MIYFSNAPNQAAEELTPFARHADSCSPIRRQPSPQATPFSFRRWNSISRGHTAIMSRRTSTILVSDARNQMIAALKAVVLPVWRERGFTGSFPHLRRDRGDQIDLITCAESPAVKPAFAGPRRHRRGSATDVFLGGVQG